jgi:hypothetical protein
MAWEKLIAGIQEETKVLIQKTDKIEKMLEIWREVATEYDVEYEIKDGKAFAKNPSDALSKEFGSGTGGTKPTYWFKKAKKQWQKRVEEEFGKL